MAAPQILVLVLLGAPPPVRQLSATTCVHAAVTSVLQHHGLDVGFDDVRRGVPSFTDGTGFFEVERWLDEQPVWVARVFRATERDLRRLARADLPVIVRVRSRHGQHAYVIDAFLGKRVTIMDPATGGSVELTASDLALRRHEAQDLVLLILPAGREAELGRLRLDRARIRAEDARFRATGWDLLAREHGSLNGQACILVAKAAAVDPTWREGLERHLSCLLAVGDPAAAEVRARLKRL